MRIRLEKGDAVFEAEREPMSPERFRTVCAVWLAVLYVVAVISYLALCGAYGVIIVIPVTVAFCVALCAVLKVDLI